MRGRTAYSCGDSSLGRTVNINNLPRLHVAIYTGIFSRNAFLSLFFGLNTVERLKMLAILKNQSKGNRKEERSDKNKEM